jgi:hypothetical protein
MNEETATLQSGEAGEDENQSLLSVEQTENAPKQNVEPNHLESDSDDIPLAVEADADKTPRPENIPSNFWDEKKGQVDVDGLAKSYVELRAKMDSGKHKAPKDGKYDLSSFENLDNDDEMVGDFIEIAKDEGLSQSVVERLTKFYLESQGQLEADYKFRRDEEMGKLGRNAEKVIEATNNWLKRFGSSGVLTNDELSAIGNASNSATFVSAINKIRRSYNEPGIPSVASTEIETTSISDIESMMGDPRYGVDMGYTNKVERMVYEMNGEAFPTKN